MKCKNWETCGTLELEAPSSLKLGVCLKFRGFYKPEISEAEMKRIWNEVDGDERSSDE